MSPFLTCFPHLPFGKALRAGQHSARARKSTSSHYVTRCVGAKNQSAPATSYKFWCLGFASSSPLLLAFRLRKSERVHPNIALFILPQNITCFVFKHLYLKILFLFGGNPCFALGAEEDVVYVYALGGADAVMVEGTLC